LLANQLRALAVDALARFPTRVQQRRKIRPGALVVMRRSDQVGLKAVVGILIRIGWRGARRERLQIRKQARLRRTKQQGKEFSEIQAAQLGIEFVADIESPAIAERSALAVVPADGFE